MRRAALTACAVTVALLGGSASAGADIFGPISLVSESASQQADYSHDPAISGDGRFLAFDGSVGGQTGVFRRDLASGALEAVAVGGAETPAGSAQLPSISANGQFVSFTTTAELTPGDRNEGPDVYVRNMSPQPGEPEYVLASAVDGSEEALAYQTSEPQKDGSVASGRGALSADGRQVVFVTTAISNLAGAGTPALQVAARDLQSDETRLVSVAENGGPASAAEGASIYGAVFSPGGRPPEFPNKSRGYSLPAPLGASISADGSTVAWMGQDIAAQVPTLSNEASPSYSEPLWRRISPAEPTRRITGGADPANPACAASGELALGTQPPGSDPCQGPFLTLEESNTKGIWQARPGDPVPQLSADGSTVAFISQAPPVGDGAHSTLYNELYVANMTAGLTRAQAARPLTAPGSSDVFDPSTTSPVVDLGISPDGTQLAFSTQRTVFPLGSPAYVSPRAGVAGMVELFDVDLADDTLTRVTNGFEGGPGEHPHTERGGGLDAFENTDGALSPSFSDDDDTLAFSSTASNLVFGDGNTPQTEGSLVFDGSDAFVVSRVVFGSDPTPQQISAAPAAPAVGLAWLLGVSAVSRANGTVQLDVEVPGAGTLRAGAQSAVRVRVKSRAHGSRRPARRGHTSVTVKSRTVASSAKVSRSSAGGLVALVLTLAKPYRALAGQKGGLSSTVSVTFAAPGRHLLRQSIAVSFRHKVKPKRRAHRAATRRGHGAKSR
jgi:WD40-like Beta Propeller Repeat